MNEQETNLAAANAANAAIDANNAWHRNNLEYLKQELSYLAQRNIVAALRASHDFEREEKNRVASRATTIEHYGIEDSPSPYEREQADLQRKSKAIIRPMLNTALKGKVIA